MSEQAQQLAKLSQQKAEQLAPKLTTSEMLTQSIAAAQQRQQQIDQDYRDNTSNLFDTDSVFGVAGNAVVGAANAAYKGVMSLPKLASELETSWDLSGHDIQQPDLENYHRLDDISKQVQQLTAQMQQTSNPEQKFELASQIASLKDNLTDDDVFFLKGDGKGESKYSVIREFYEDRQRNQTLQGASKYFDKYVDQSKVQAAAEEFGIDFDKSAPEIMAGIDKMKSGDTLAGLGKAISGSLSLAGDTVGTVVKNPEAVIQVMAESAPEIYMAAKSLVTATLMAGGRSISDNMEEWAAEHEGKIALGDERTKVMLWSAAEAITATMGDKVLASGGSLKRAITGSVEKSASKTTLKNAVPKAAAFLGKTGGQEYVQEGAEEALSQMAVKGETDAREMHVAGGLGFGAGAGTSTITNAAIAAKEKTQQVKANLAAKKEARKLSEEVEKVEVPKEESVIKTAPTIEEVATAQENIQVLNTDITTHKTENKHVQAIVDNINQVNENLQHYSALSSAEDSDILDLLSGSTQAVGTVGNIKTTVQEALQDDSLTAEDKTVLNKVVEQIDAGNLDSITGALAANVTANPKLKEELDTMFNVFTAGTEEEQGAIYSKLTQDVDNLTEEEVEEQKSSLVQALMQTKLYSKDIIENDDISPEQLDNAANMTTGEVSEQYAALAEFKRSFESVATDVETGKENRRLGIYTRLGVIKESLANGDNANVKKQLEALANFYNQRRIKYNAIKKVLDATPADQRIKSELVTYSQHATGLIDDIDRGEWRILAGKNGAKATEKLLVQIQAERAKIGAVHNAAKNLVGLQGKDLSIPTSNAPKAPEPKKEKIKPTSTIDQTLAEAQAGIDALNQTVDESAAAEVEPEAPTQASEESSTKTDTNVPVEPENTSEEQEEPKTTIGERAAKFLKTVTHNTETKAHEAKLKREAKAKAEAEKGKTEAELEIAQKAKAESNVQREFVKSKLVRIQQRIAEVEVEAESIDIQLGKDIDRVNHEYDQGLEAETNAILEGKLGNNKTAIERRVQVAQRAKQNAITKLTAKATHSSARKDAQLEQLLNQEEALKQELDNLEQKNKEYFQEEYRLNNEVLWSDVMDDPESLDAPVEQARKFVNKLINALTGKQALAAVSKFTGSTRNDTSELNETQLQELTKLILEHKLTKADRAAVDAVVKKQMTFIAYAPDELVNTLASLRDKSGEFLNRFKAGIVKYRDSLLWNHTNLLDVLGKGHKAENYEVTLTKELLELPREGVNPPDRAMLKHLAAKRTWFHGQMDKIAAKVNKNITSSSTITRNQNALQDLLDEQGNFPAKIKDAAFLAYLNTVDIVGRSMYTDTNQLLNLFGFTSKEQLSDIENLNEFRVMGTPITRKQFGSAFNQALGLRLDQNVPESVKDALMSSMGYSLHAIAQSDPEIYTTQVVTTGGSTKYGFTVKTEQNQKSMAKNQARAKAKYLINPKIKNVKGKKVIVPFPEQSLAPSQFLVNMQDGSGLLKKISAPENEEPLNYIGTPPPKVTQSTQHIRGSGNLTREEVAAENLARQIKWEADSTVESFAEIFLGEEGFKELNGYVYEEELEKLNKNTAISAEGKNLKIVDQYEKSKALYKSLKKAEDPTVYFANQFSIVRRQQMRGAINPQGDKWARIVLGLKKSPSISMDLGNLKHKTKSPSQMYFTLALGQALGFKADKQENDTTYKQTVAVLQEAYAHQQYLNGEEKGVPSTNPTILIASKLASFMHKGVFNEAILEDSTMRKERNELIRLMREEVGNNFHRQQGILTLAKLLNSADSQGKVKGFKHYLRFEIDGLTNGPFHSIFLTGLGNMSAEEVENVLLKGGLVVGHDTKGSHAEIGKILDLYETGAATGTEYLEAYTTELAKVAPRDSEKQKLRKKNMLESNKFLMSKEITLAGNRVKFANNNGIFSFVRNLFKNPTTVTVYAGGAKGISDNITRAYAETFYGELSEYIEQFQAVRTSKQYTELKKQFSAELQKWNTAMFPWSPFYKAQDDKGVWRNTARLGLLDKLMHQPMKQDALVQELQDYTLSSAEMEGLGNTLSKRDEGIAYAVNQAIDDVFANNKHTGALMNAAMTFITAFANDLFKQAYTSLHAQRVSEGAIREYDTLSTLDTKHVLKDIQKALPFVKTALQADQVDVSKKGTAGIMQTNKTAAISPEGTTTSNNTQIDHTTKNMASPGVRTIPVLVISVDGNTQIKNHLLQGHTGSYLNVLDAIDAIAGGNLRVQSELFNVAETLSVMNSDPLHNVFEAFIRSLKVQQQDITVADQVITPTFKALQDSGEFQDKEGRLTQNQELYRQAVGELTLPVHKKLPSFFDGGNIEQLLAYVGHQLKTEAIRNQQQRDRFVFTQDLTMSQMGGIDNGGAKLVKGELVLSPKAWETLTEEGRNMVESYNYNMAKRREDWENSTHESPADTALEHLRKEALFGDKEALYEIHTQLNPLSGELFQEMRGTFNFSANEMTYSLKDKDNTETFKKKLFGEVADVVRETGTLVLGGHIANMGLGFNLKGKPSPQLNSVLRNTQIIITDNLEEGANGKMVVERKGNKLTYKVYVRKGITTREASLVLAHELVHATSDNGLRKGVMDFFTKKSSLESTLVTEQLNQIRRLAAFHKGKKVHTRIQTVLDLLNKYEAQPNKSNLFVLLHEHLAHVTSESKSGDTYELHKAFNVQEVKITSLDAFMQKYIKNSLISLAKYLTKTFGGFFYDKKNPWSQKNIGSKASVTEIELLGSIMRGYTEAAPDIRLYPKEQSEALYSRDNSLDQVIKEKIVTSAALDKELTSTDTAMLAEAYKRISTEVLEKMEDKFVQMNPEDAFYTAAKTAPYLDTLTNAGIRLPNTAKYVFSLVSTSLNEGAENHWYSRTQLKELFQAARKQLKPTDFMNPDIAEGDLEYAEEKQRAKAKYTAIFYTANQGYLGNFAALAEVSPWFQNILSKVSTKEEGTSEKGNMVNKLHKSIHSAFKAIGNKAANIDPNSSTATKMSQLAANIHSVDVKQDYRVVNKTRAMEDKLDSLIKTAAHNGSTKLLKALSGIGLSGKLLSDYADMSAAQRSQFIGEQINKLVAGSANGKKMNTLLEIFAEFIPRNHVNSKLIDAHRDRKSYAVDSVRESTREIVKEELENGYVTKLTEEESKAVAMGIRADISALLQTGNRSFGSIAEHLTDATKLQENIDSLTRSFLNVPNLTKAQRTLMLNEAAALGMRSITGGSYQGFNLPNAAAIAGLYGTGIPVSNEATRTAVEPILDELASLLSLKAMSQKDKQELSKVISRELARTDGGNGLAQAVATFDATNARIVKRYGDKARLSLPKGHIPLVTDPNISVRVVPKKDMYKYKGYSFVRNVARDPQDLTQTPLVMIRSEEGGNVPFVQGAMDIIEQSLGGFTFGNGKATDKNLPHYAASGIQRGIALKKKQELTGTMSQKLLKPTRLKDGMVPHFNALGQVTGYRYVLNHTEQTELAGMENDSNELLSIYDARIQEESVAEEHNKVLAKILFDAYDQAEDKDMFVRVAADVKDPELQQLWKVTPHYMKQELHKHFGEAAVYVHKRDLTNALGFREASISKLWDEQRYKGNKYVQGVTDILDAIFGEDAVTKLRWVERAVQEGVMAAKDLITVKSIVVPAGNAISNVNQLHLNGISGEDIHRNMVTSINGVRDYKRTHLELLRVTHQLDTVTEPEEQTKLEAQRSQLEQDLKTNPVYPFVAEGLLPSVVEDLDQENTKGTIKQSILDKYLPQLDQEGNAFVDAGKEIMITKDSSLYKLLSESLELGDFAGKFTLYRHLVDNEGMSHEDAIAEARVQFINYGTLSNKSLDYLNKTGGVFFMKYFMRGQAIQLRTMMKRPTRSFVTLVGADAVGVDNIFDAMFINKDLGNATGLYDLMGMASGAHPVEGLL